MQRVGAEGEVDGGAGGHVGGAGVERDDPAAAGIGVDQPRGAKFLDIIDHRRDGAGRGRAPSTTLGPGTGKPLSALMSSRPPVPCRNLPSASNSPSSRFMAGEPMKSATKRLCGLL